MNLPQYETDYAEQQELLAAIRKLIAPQNASFLQGSMSSGDGRDSAAELPSLLHDAGIPIPALALRNYTRVTGLTYTPGDPAPELVPDGNDGHKYALPGR